ncbi:MAG: adenylate/guanylate cyclase domain-containing response regulator [Anaerolineae bacterium]|nr:adenylate/guanylate cyclase domain-containing response regulator [Anaerolineae bacterium]
MRWFANLKTQNKLLLTFAIIALVGAVTTGWSMVNVLRLQEKIRQVERETSALAEVAKAQGYFLRRWIDSKNYLLTDDAYFPGQYQRYDEQLDAYLRRAHLNANTTDKNEDLTTLEQNLGEYNAAVAAIELAYEMGDTDETLTIQRSLDEADSLADAVQAQIEVMLIKRELTLQELTQQTRQQVRNTLFLGLSTLVLLTILVIGSASIAHQITEPVMHLTNAVAALETNTYNPESLTKYIRRRDEMGKLTRAFAAMVESITTSARERELFLQAAERFVPDQYLEFLEKPSLIDVKLGDHVSAEMAVMFSDIRGFTTMSEDMSPQENFDFVNAYLQMVSPIIQRYDGFIVKFLGDGMMAIFPYAVDDAVRAGIEKQRQVEAFNVELHRKGLPPIQVGIGIHTGHMMVGMIGEEMRMQGDAFSDNVNLTSRLEGLTKFYGISMIISEETLMRLQKPIRYQMRYLGKAQVKGREHPIALYEVYDGAPESVRLRREQTKADFERGLKLYTTGKFTEAIASFKAVLQRDPDDKTAALYLEHATAMLNQPLPEDWDGVEVMTSK